MRYGRSRINFKSYAPPARRSFLFFKKSKRRTPVSPDSTLGRYENPHRLTKNTGYNFFIFIKKVFLPALFLAWLCLIAYLPYFRITRVLYTGLKIINQEELASVVNQGISPKHIWWPSNNYFLLRTKFLSELLLKNPSLSGVNITKKFPNTLIVSIEEKISSLVYFYDGGYYLVDHSGLVTKELFSTKVILPPVATSTNSAKVVISSPSSTDRLLKTANDEVILPDYTMIYRNYGKYPIIFGVNKIVVGQYILSEGIISGLINFHKAIEQGRVAQVRYFTVSDPQAGAEAILDRSWKIIFQPVNEIDEQVENVKIILKENKPASYIDVRFGDRVYWK